MPNYVDGYVIPVPTKNIPAYVRLAKKASKLWIEHGAVAYHECVGDDLDVKWGRTFPAATEAKKRETVVFAWIVFKSRAHRDRVNAAVMKDPRIAEMCDPKNSPFDPSRMVVGGFKVAVSA